MIHSALFKDKCNTYTVKWVVQMVNGGLVEVSCAFIYLFIYLLFNI